MALPLQSFSVIEVAKPRIGEPRPSRVRADLAVAVGFSSAVRRNWESLRRHDVCFLLCVQPTGLPVRDETGKRNSFQDCFQILVRGCEVEGMLDDDGRVIEEGPEPKPAIQGSIRIFRVWLDVNQYQTGMEAVLKLGCRDPYETLNLVVRRKAKENNFKAALGTIRELMNTDCVVQSSRCVAWLRQP